MDGDGDTADDEHVRLDKIAVRNPTVEDSGYPLHLTNESLTPRRVHV